MTNPTAAPWYWHTDHDGRVSLRTPDRGNLIVMDLRRKGMQGAEPRFAHWPGIDAGDSRMRRGGILEPGLDHPDARLIAYAPELLDALIACTTDEGPEQGELDRARALIAKILETTDPTGGQNG